jgi:hypothetical protein
MARQTFTNAERTLRHCAADALYNSPITPATGIARDYVRAWLLGRPIGDGTLIRQFIAELEDASIAKSEAAAMTGD